MIKRGTAKLFFAAACCGFLPLADVSWVAAASSNISHSYTPSGSVFSGDLVSLDTKRAGHIQPANTQNGSQLLGVVVKADDSLLAVNSDSSQVQVATEGTVNTLVSTLNGNIKAGDQISVSPFNGVGMKALPGSEIIGLAQTALNSSTAGSRTQEIKNLQGKDSSVMVGFIQLSIAVGANPASSSAKLSGLQKFVERLTSHSVSTSRIIISCAVAFMTLLALISIIYSAIYGSIIAIGRNPLAKHTILRSLTTISLMAGLIAALGISIMYFLLY